MDPVPLERGSLDLVSVPAREFYQRPTAEVARDLLGRLLLRSSTDGLVALRITEVEAYLGPGDPACHTYGGRRTERTRAMWGEAGHAYVYLVYGLHTCLNVVTVGGGAGEAVLLRGGIVVHGDELVRRRRPPATPRRSLTDGPGKLCQALAVDRHHDGGDLCDRSSGLWLGDDGVRVPDNNVRCTPRIGVAYAGEAASWPLRFVAEGLHGPI